MSLTPTPSIDTSQFKRSTRRFHVSAEDILTLGTIKLFRSVSRNNRYTSDNDPPHEWELSRWTSVNSAQSAPASSLNNGSFLGSSFSRSQSTKRPSSSGTFNGNKRNSGMNGGVSSASNTKHTSRKGVRMLNGRVYGAPKLKGNPFDNVRDEADPEFVEWGYGGMGSVSGGRAAGMSGTRWERLQSGQSPDDPSLDDGSSGMGWVKKRREARERTKAKEEGKNEAQAADSCDASAPKPDLESSATAPVANPEENSSKPPIHPRPSPNITRPPSEASTSTPRSNYVIPSEGEHFLHAVTIPAKQHHHHHYHHHHHRSTSNGTLVSAGDDEAKPDTPNDHRAEYQSEESESEEENDDEEESDSSGFGQSKRITALGAGVEKYTRHKESERDQMTVMPSVSE